MPTSTTHPAPEQLASFVRGELASDELDEVAGHVRSCDSCCVAVQRARAETQIVVTPGPAESPPARPAPSPSLLAKAEPLPLKVPAALLDHPQYQIIGQLGEGGMGVVYKAEHRMMGRVVALKVITPKLTSKATVVARFVKEVKAAARLTHPNIVTAYDAGEAGGLHFLVMEFVEGISLDRFVARRGGTLPVALACQFARQAAFGLQHAHEQGMVHRDIKPANLMVTRKGQIKILDFGLARLVQDENDGAGPAATAANLVMGTPDYLSPEQARNSHTVDIRSDIYSLGCTLYYLLTGHVPFSNATTLIEKLVAHTREEPPPIQTSRLDVPDALVTVLAKMMAKRPDDRYSTPAEAAAALAPFARGPGLGAVTNPGMSGVLGPRPGSPAASQPGSVELVEVELVSRPEAATPTTPPKLTTKTGSARPQEPLTRSPSRKKKARPPAWTPRWAKWVAFLTVLVGGLAVGALAPFLFTKDQTLREVLSAAPKPLPQVPPHEEKAPPPAPPPAKSATRPSAKQEPVKPTPPPTPTPPPPPTPTGPPQKVLFILQHKGLSYNDYEPLRSEIEKMGLKTVTGAPVKGGTAEFFNKVENVGPPVEIQLVLTETTDLAEFAAVAICGREVKEYLGESREAKIVKSTIQRMLDKNRFVIGVGLGQEVLAKQGFLRGQKAAGTKYLMDHYPASSGIDWRPESEGPIKSGLFMTLSRPYAQATRAVALIPWPTPSKK